jgi:hydroxyacylglutathione hydrolase
VSVRTPRLLVEVVPGVLVATAGRYTTTSTVVVGDDAGCLLVDPALTEQELRGLAGALEARGLRAVAAFSTHPHWDHLLWHPALGQVPRWATARATAAARAHAAELREQAAEEAPGLDALGDLTALPDGAAHLPWDGPATAVLAHDGHAPGHAGVLARGVLVAGDMLSDLEVPLLDLSAADPLGDYSTALDLLAAALLRSEVRAIVPGHGRPTDRDGALARLDADRRYLDAVAGGRPLDADQDARLADPWTRGEHERQVRTLRSRGSG